MSVRPPIVGAAVWSAVMKRAGDRCECRGACGKKHADRNRRPGRCELTNDEYVSKRKARIHLIATPRDPVNEGDFVTAAQLRPSRLIAFCPDCYDGVRRIFKRAEKQMAPQDEGLFDTAEFYVDPATKKQADVGAA
ncbi:hypothetical protein [Streptomyces indicus]|uniref:Uncharacterized protein n=1 Tax=Streptomyces indicus TaxID=417292 RepID=A0A1G9IUA4_9ACTN|nr:hypothetical protein [Streptomyces indicus]SDL28929.1 hypothetical protein SAMN05421806_12581 [Streptomyces indicus]